MTSTPFANRAANSTEIIVNESFNSIVRRASNRIGVIKKARDEPSVTRYLKRPRFKSFRYFGQGTAARNRSFQDL
jgi:hypothetical protein